MKKIDMKNNIEKEDKYGFPDEDKKEPTLFDKLQ